MTIYDQASANCAVQDRWIDGDWAPFCTYDRAPADPREREQAYQQHHSPGGSWVVDSVTLIRSNPDEVCVLRNAEFTRFTAAGKVTRTVDGPPDYQRLMTEVFDLSALPITEVLQARDEIAGWRRGG